jgi:hypothetical protein
MSSFRDLQNIYEGAWTFGPNQGRIFTGNQSQISLSQTPGQLPGQGPGKFNQYDLNAGSSSNPIRFGENEEGENIPVKNIRNTDILAKIEELKAESDNEGMDYATMMLGRLGEYIKSL